MGKNYGKLRLVLKSSSYVQWYQLLHFSLWYSTEFYLKLMRYNRVDRTFSLTESFQQNGISLNNFCQSQSKYSLIVLFYYIKIDFFCRVFLMNIIWVTLAVAVWKCTLKLHAAYKPLSIYRVSNMPTKSSDFNEVIP